MADSVLGRYAVTDVVRFTARSPALTRGSELIGLNHGSLWSDAVWVCSTLNCTPFM